MNRAIRRVAAGCIATAAASGALAARLPEWARPIAQAAPAVPDGVPEHAIRILYRGVRLEVLPEGQGLRVRERIAVQVQSGKAEAAGLRSFPFDDTAKLKTARGWSLPPGERAARANQDPVEMTLPSAFLTDRKLRLIAMPNVGKGALVFFEFEAEETPYALTWRDLFFEDAPIDRASVETVLPAGWDVKSAWLPGPGPEAAKEGSTWRWELADLVPAADEPLGDAPSSLAPRLVLAFQPPSPGRSSIPTFATWADLSAWYVRLAAGRADPSPAIRTEAGAAMDAAGDDPVARALAAARFVRDRVRYVAREVGVGGYQPRAADQTYRDRAGDCKDKATLLQAVLAVDGRTAYPILINATRSGTVAVDVPDPHAFDHVVLGVLLAPGATVSNPSAVVDAGELGRLLVVDVTDEYAPPGTLPVNLADKLGLVVAAGAQGRLVRTAPARAEDHGVATTVEIELRADKSMRARWAARRFGEPAELARRDGRWDSKEREADVARAIREAIPDATVTGYTMTPEASDASFVESMVIDVPPPPAGRQAEPRGFFARALADLPRVPLVRRSGAVVYGYPRTLTYETTVVGLGKATALPSGQRTGGEGWAVESSFTPDGAALRAKWRLELTRTRFASDAFVELRQLWSAASKSVSPLIPAD